MIFLHIFSTVLLRFQNCPNVHEKDKQVLFRTLAYVSLIRKHKQMFCLVVKISKLEWILQVFDSSPFISVFEVCPDSLTPDPVCKSLQFVDLSLVLSRASERFIAPDLVLRE